ncbi:uncharacterized protein [Dermacentor albipictus]|uniref:uncharacterized protein isoform X1 n=1 Tax=Dermacentor albipictus TaxID=60249 RepID=UPI0031FBFA60
MNRNTIVSLCYGCAALNSFSFLKYAFGFYRRNMAYGWAFDLTFGSECFLNLLSDYLLLATYKDFPLPSLLLGKDSMVLLGFIVWNSASVGVCFVSSIALAVHFANTVRTISVECFIAVRQWYKTHGCVCNCVAASVVGIAGGPERSHAGPQGPERGGRRLPQTNDDDDDIRIFAHGLHQGSHPVQHVLVLQEDWRRRWQRRRGTHGFLLPCRPDGPRTVPAAGVKAAHQGKRRRSAASSRPLRPHGGARHSDGIGQATSGACCGAAVGQAATGAAALRSGRTTDAFHGASHAARGSADRTAADNAAAATADRDADGSSLDLLRGTAAATDRSASWPSRSKMGVKAHVLLSRASLTLPQARLSSVLGIAVSTCSGGPSQLKIWSIFLGRKNVVLEQF